MPDFNIIKTDALLGASGKRSGEVDQQMANLQVIKEVKEVVKELKETVKVLDDICSNIDRSAINTFETQTKNGRDPEAAWDAAERMAQKRYDVLGAALAQSGINPHQLLANVEQLEGAATGSAARLSPPQSAPRKP